MSTNIKQIRIETVFTGVIYLISLILLSLTILDEPPSKTIDFLKTIGSGTAVLLIAILFLLSFFLGRVAEHFFIAANYVCQPNKRTEYIKAFVEGTESGVWGNKIFSLSSSIGILILGTVLLITAEGDNETCAIIVIGLILLTGTGSSFFYWFNLGRRLSQIKNQKV